ncbi:TIR domain-containing protein [Caballeronia novacaledonica]|uniref:TIR domain-containing protein n=1 Tax=Caballeronia novacaledonica TaxID=1544861 RepID=A0ACB5QTP3_9BURK|nr:TIR domain-containing protein [Caballeronia novacaledonica]
MKAREALDGLRRQGPDAPRFVLLLGASGSGKSSLMRAGVIPRLKKDALGWLPLPVFRPQAEPLDELGAAFLSAFATRGAPRDAARIRGTLLAAASAHPADGEVLLQLARELALASGHQETTVLITIDQAEELFGYSATQSADRFLRLIRAALELPQRQIMVAATLRSDCLADFQGHVALRDGQSHALRYTPIPVDPVPLRNFSQIIRGPATLAGLRVDDGLVEAMINDTGGRDALPLLAFTLRRLYELGEDGHLSMARYEAMGGLEGSVRDAAQRVIDGLNPTDEEMAALQAAFVPSMVRINAEGNFARRRAVVDEMPRGALALLRRFIDARLLVTDRDSQGKETIEVAHEALLRTWPQLAAWLAEDRDKLRMLDGIQRSAEEWDAGGRRDDLLNHRNDRLKEAETLVAHPRFALYGTSLEHAYLEASRRVQRAAEEAKQEEQERRLRDAERIAQEQSKAAVAQKRTARVALLGLVAALVVAAIALWQFHRATRETQIATARQLAAQSRIDLDADAPRNVLLALESITLTQQAGAFNPSSSRQALNDVLGASGGVPLRHRSPVNAVAFSLDDRWIATGSDEGVQLWSASIPGAPPRLLRTRGTINALAFTPDGHTIAGAGEEGTVTLWDMQASQPEASAKVLDDRHEKSVVDLAVSRDGRWLATASDDGTARLWDLSVPGGKPTGFVLRHDKVVRTVAFSPDSRQLASGGEDGAVRLWDLTAPDPSAHSSARDLRNDIRKLAYSPDGKWLIAGSTEILQAFLFRVAAPEEPHQLKVNQWVSAAAFSPDGRWLALPSQYEVLLWDLSKDDAWKEPLVLPGHKSAIADLAFSPDGAFLATASTDHTVHLWKVSDHFSAPEILPGHEAEVTHLAFSHDGHSIVTGSLDQTARIWRTAAPFAEPFALRTDADGSDLRIWNISGMSIVPSQRTLGESVDRGSGSAFSPDSKWMAIISRNDDGEVIHLWDLTAPSPRHFAIRHGGSVLAEPVFSPDGRWLATAGWDNPTIKLWDLKSVNPLDAPRVLKGHAGPVRSLAFNGDGRFLVSGARDGYALVWDLHDDRGVPTRRLEGGDVNAVAISRDGRHVGLGNWEPDFAAVIWDLDLPASQTNPITLKFGQRVDDVAFSPNGRWFAAGSWDQTTKLLDLSKTGTEPYVLKGHRARTLSLAFSPDSQWLATGNEDRSARLWNLTQSDPSVDSTVLQAGDKVGAVSFSPDGRWIALTQSNFRSMPFSPDGQSFVSSNSNSWLYHIGLDDLRQEACTMAGRNMTQEEWRKFLGT